MTLLGRKKIKNIMSERLDSAGNPLQDPLTEQEEFNEDTQRNYREDIFSEEPDFNKGNTYVQNSDEQDLLQRANNELNIDNGQGDYPQEEGIGDDWHYDSRYSLMELGAGKIFKFILITAISFFAVISAIFYFFFYEKDDSELDAEKILHNKTAVVEIIQSLYTVADVTELVKKNPKVITFFADDAKHLVDLSDTDLYNRKYSEFNNESLKAQVTELKVTPDFVYVKYTIHSDLNVDSNRYATFEFNEQGYVTSFKEYWEYIIQ